MSSKNIKTTLSENAEEYLEILYKLSMEYRPVKTAKISKTININSKRAPDD